MKIYNLPVVLYSEATPSMAMDVYIRSIGFSSCKFVLAWPGAYWEMSDDDYLWFALRFE